LICALFLAGLYLCLSKEWRSIAGCSSPPCWAAV
jgi:hypothetical protein